MQRTAWWRLSGMVLLAAGGCWQESAGLQDIQVRVEVTPERLDFGSVRAGTVGQRSLTVHNRSAGPARVDAVEVLGDGVFALDGADRWSIPAGEERTLNVTVMGNSPGRFTGTLRIHSNSQQTPQLDVPLTVTLDPPEDCEDHNPCTLDRWEAEGCVHLPVAGSCDDSNACTTGDHCEDGRCVGDALPCVDSVDCTVDACDPQRGCTHTPLAARCADGDPCTRDACDPVTGCRWESGDGDSCGDRDGCVSMPVCWAGQCVPVPVPDGLACDDGDPDSSQDICRQGHCAGTRPQLISAWPAGPSSAITVDADGVYWTSAPDAQGMRVLLHVSGAGMPPEVLARDVEADILLTDAENVYWVDHHNGVVVAVSKAGGRRWEALAPGCGPVLAQDGAYLFWARGGQVWRADKVQGIPELRFAGSGRIAGLAADETGVYVTDSGDNTVMRPGRPSWLRAVTASGVPGAIAVDESHVYWLEGGNTVAAMPKDGGEVVRRPGLGSGYTQLLVDADSIYLANPWEGVDRLAKVGRGENLLASVRAVTPRVYAVFDGFLYYVDNGVVLREPVTGGIQVVARDVPAMSEPRVVGDDFYWISGEGIQRYSLVTGDTVTLVPHPENIAGLAVDGDGLFWSQWYLGDGLDGQVWTARLDGSEPRVLSSSVGHPGGIFTTPNQVVWFSEGEDMAYQGWLNRYPKQGGERVSVSARGEVHGWTAKGSFAVWNALHCDDCDAHTIGADLETGTTRLLASPAFGGLTLDGPTVYGLNWPCSVARVPVTGGPVEQVLQFGSAESRGWPDVSNGQARWLSADTVVTTSLEAVHPREVARVAGADFWGWTPWGLLARGPSAALFNVPRSITAPELVSQSGMTPQALVAWPGGAAWLDAPLEGLGSVNVVQDGPAQTAFVVGEQGRPNSAAWADGVLYWTDSRDGMVKSIPDTGGPVHVLAHSQLGADHLAVSGGLAAWITTDGCCTLQVRTAPVGAPDLWNTAASEPFAGPVHHLELAGGTVYFLSASGLYQVQHGGGWQRLLTDVGTFTVDAQAIYYVSGRALWRRLLDGGDATPTHLASALPGTPLLQVGAQLAFLDFDLNLVTLPKSATEADTPVVLHHFPTLPWALGFTDTQVWWAAPEEVGWFPR